MFWDTQNEKISDRWKLIISEYFWGFGGGGGVMAKSERSVIDNDKYLKVLSSEF